MVGDNYLTIRQNFRMKGDTTFNLFTQSFEVGKPFVFEKLEFKSNSSKLSASLKPNLDHLVRFLNNYPQFKLIIEGHTD
ncbi:MAG: OmpA family protein, partial [Bacteroidota bacterium]